MWCSQNPPASELENRAARISTGSNYDAPSKPLIGNLSWKTIIVMIQFELRVMVFKSLNQLSCNTSLICFWQTPPISHTMKEVQTPIIRYQRKTPQLAREASRLEVLNFGIVHRPALSRIELGPTNGRTDATFHQAEMSCAASVKFCNLQKLSTSDDCLS